MKTFKNLKNSIILLAIFLLCAGFSRGILRPVNAALPQVESVFEVISNPDVHLGNWVQNVAWSAAMNAPIKLACGGEKDMDSIFVEDKPCMSEEELNNMYAYVESGRMPAGLYSLGTVTLSYIVADPTVPTNLALFIDDIKKDTLFNTSSYAAAGATGYSEPTEFFQITTLGVWKTTRNLALALLGLFLAIAALGVLFRQKLSPQAVVTIYSILPSVPLAIIFIVLSYPVVAVAMNLTGPLNTLAIKLGTDVFSEISNSSSGGAAGLTITGILITILASFVTTGPFAVALSIPIVTMGVAILVLIIVAIFKVIYEFIKWYGTFVILTIAFPIAAVVSILPGKQPVLMTFVKKLIVNMLVFPVGIFLTFVGFGFIMTTFDNSVGLGIGWAAYVFVFGIFVSLIKFFIGYGIIWNAFKIRGILENSFGATGSVMSAFSGGGDDKMKRR